MLGEVAGLSESAEGHRGITHIVLAGPVVAFLRENARTPNAEGLIQWWVVVRDLRSGRVLHKVPTGMSKAPSPGHGSGEEGARVVGAGPTINLVVKSDGAVAWTVDTEEGPGRQVWAIDRSGKRLVAEGTNLDPHSLALAGSTIYWTQDGQAFSAPLN